MPRAVVLAAIAGATLGQPPNPARAPVGPRRTGPMGVPVSTRMFMDHDALKVHTLIRAPQTPARPSSINVRNRAPGVTKAGVTIRYDPYQPHSGFFSAGFAHGWEDSTFAVFRRFVNNASVVLDIGAWIGPTALWFAKVARHVVALEPTEAAFRELKRNLDTNVDIAPGTIDIVNAGMSDRSQTAGMSNRGDSMDQLELERRRRERRRLLQMPRINGTNERRLLQKINVRVTNIADLEEQYPILREVSFVKVDTEGFERRIMPALHTWLKERKPVVFLSLHPMYTSISNVSKAVAVMRDVFPFVWESDMRSPFDYAGHHGRGYQGDTKSHGGVDMLGTWHDITKSKPGGGASNTLAMTLRYELDGRRRMA